MACERTAPGSQHFHLLHRNNCQMRRDERGALIVRFSTLPQQLDALLTTHSQAQLTVRPDTGGWSVAQVVHHLADSRMVSFVRMKLVLTEENPKYGSYNESAWGALPDADNAALETSLDLLHGLHSRWHVLLLNLPDAAWARVGTHAETRVVSTLEEMLARYSSHGEIHLEQIQRILAA